MISKKQTRFIYIFSAVLFIAAYAWIFIDFFDINFRLRLLASYPVFYAGIKLYRYASRFTQHSADEILAIDERQPILMLRSFQRDNLEIRGVHEKDHGSFWVMALPMLYPLYVYSSGINVTFEEMIVDCFKKLGPVISIGKPGEATQPLGAHRKYVGDDDWHEWVLKYAEMSYLIIILLDFTRGLVWEIQEMTGRFSAEKILFIFPPFEEFNDEEKASWLQEYAKLQMSFAFLPEYDESIAAVQLNDSGEPTVIESDSRASSGRISAIKRCFIP